MFVTKVIEQYAVQTPNKEAIVYRDKGVTYKGLYDGAKKIADFLTQSGVSKGDIVAQFALNSELFLMIYVGVQMAGVTVMPVNTKLAPPEVDYIFTHSEAKVLIVDEALQATIDATTYSFERVVTLQQIREIIQTDTQPLAPVELQREDVAVVMYTSGTTGKPKGVMLTHANIYETATIWTANMHFTEKDRTFICTPLFHCAGTNTFSLPTLINGGTVVVEEAFSPEKILQQIEETKATVFFGVPAMFTLILSKPDLGNYNLQNLRLFVYGASPMPYELIKKLKQAFPNVQLHNSYGQTENSPAASSLTDAYALDKIGSVGKPLSRTDIKLVNSLGEEVPVGEVGEICVKGPQVMKGYLKNPEETARTIQDEWMYSGDLGRFDEEGFLYIVDRKKDMIIRGGENIYPIEIEEVLYQIPEILEAAVVGVPHDVYGEVPKAFVVLKEVNTIDEAAILQYVAGQLAKYKVPAEIEFIQELPRNASGKVLKHTLRPKQVTEA